MGNIYSLQLLRNGAAYANKEVAKTALQSASGLTGVINKDGVAVLARYLYDGTEGKQVRTLVGYYAVSSAMTGTDGYDDYMTIIDVEGAADSVEELRTEINNKLGTGITSENTATAQLAALSGTPGASSAETSVEGAKSYADEKVRAAVDALDKESVANENKVITDVTQANGVITATPSLISGVKLSGYTVGGDDSGEVAETDTLGQALGKLQGQINGMDKTASAVDGQVVTTISEIDGKVSETKANVKDLQLGGYAKTNDTGDIASGDTINVALSKLENKTAAITINDEDKSINVTPTISGTDISVNIKTDEHVLAKDGNAGLYTDIKLSAVTVSEANVKEAFGLIATDGSQLGSTIKIYKDSSLLSVALLHADTTANPQVLPTYNKATNTWTDIDTTAQTQANQALCFAYENVSGNTVIAAVPVGSFINEQEFASGVTWDATAGKVRGVVDSTSETFLTVGADGFKLAGVQNAIDTAISGLDADVSGNSTHVTVGVEEVNGVITAVTVAESNIANATDLTELSGKTVTAITSTNGSITATINDAVGNKTYNIETDASKIKMSGFTAAASGLTAITTASTVTEAVKAIETEMIDNEQTTSAALNDLNNRIDELSGGTTADLEKEIAERRRIEGQSASAYTANSGKAYISGATSLNDADVKLNDALAALDADVIKTVKVNNTTLAKTENAVNIQVVAGSTAANDANAIHVDTANDGTITLTLGSLDCGTY